MSSELKNEMGPVKAIDEKKLSDEDKRVQKVAELIKKDAIHKLHQIHAADKVHGFHEADKAKHIAAWKLYSYAEEKVAYGVNYFMKVDIGEEHFLHLRAHRQKSHDIYDFYSLHESFGPKGTCVWSKDDPLKYFNA